MRTLNSLSNLFGNIIALPVFICLGACIANTKFTNFTLSTGVNYRITKTFAVDLYFDHNDFTTESPALNYTVLRNVVGFALTAEWR